VQLVSKISNLCDPDPPTLQTDGRTDRRTTCNLNTVLCTSASRGKNQKWNNICNTNDCQAYGFEEKRRLHKMYRMIGVLKDVRLRAWLDYTEKAAAKENLPRSSLQHFMKTGSDGECWPGLRTILTKKWRKFVNKMACSNKQRGDPCFKGKLAG